MVVPVRILVANGRTIYRTGDYGQSWAQILLDHSGDCVSDYFGDIVVSPADPNRLYLTQICDWFGIYGDSGTDYRVLMSTDAGLTWTYPSPRYAHTPVPSPVLPQRVYIKDALAGVWLQTDDSGTTWITKTFPVNVLALDAQNDSYLYGLAGNVGQRSQNAGESWLPWPTQPCGAYSQLVAHPTLPNILWVRCGDDIYRSVNSGDSWQPLPAFGNMVGNDYGHAGRIFLSRPDGLWASIDSGTTWTHLTVDFTSPRLVGWQWYQAASPLSVADFRSLTQIDAVAPHDVWAVGCKTSTDGSVFHWDGSLWASTPVYDCLTGLDMLSATSGWAVGYFEDMGPRRYDILRWDGVDWTRNFSTSVPLKAIEMVSENDGWAVGGAVMRWNGSDWISVTTSLTQTLLSLSMLSSTDGWAVGENGALARWNGSEWASVTGPVTQTLRAVDMLSSTDGWAVGDEGVILRWDGNSWVVMLSPTSQRLNAIDLVGADSGWGVGEAGTVLYWDGNTWSLSEGPTQAELRAVAMVSVESGWMGGSSQVPLARFANVFLPTILR
jgi:hypothetical protein